jgi:hypothetical protein
MCWICDHPGATWQDYLDRLQAMIDESGWTVVQVEPDGIHPPWAYTVGLTRYGLPELVVTGMPVDRACCVLNCLAGDQVAHHAPYPPGSTHGVTIQGCRTDGLLVTVTRPWAHLNEAADFYGEDIRAMQFVHADEVGHWPWETGYRGGIGGQPVLGDPEHAGPAERAG